MNLLLRIGHYLEMAILDDISFNEKEIKISALEGRQHVAMGCLRTRSFQPRRDDKIETPYTYGRRINSPWFSVTATEILSITTGLDQTPSGFRQLVRTGYLAFKNLGLMG